MADIHHPDFGKNYPTDRLTGGRIITDSNHSQVHAGNGFSFGTSGALAQGAVDTYTFTVPDNTYIHFQALAISSDGGNELTVALFDQTKLNATPAGTLITPKNRHRQGVGLRATGLLTLAANPTTEDTFTIGTRVYTLVDNVGADDELDNIDIGASAAATVTNIVNAITLAAGTPGTNYATAQTVNTDVWAVDGAGDTVIFYALTPGSAGNALATTEVFANVGNVFGATTLTGGEGPLARRESWASNVTVRLDPTVDYIGYDNFDTIVMFKQGAVSSKSEASREDSIEWVIRDNATFSVRFTNTGVGVGTVNYTFRPFWYEEDGA